jgi:alpha-methylacyl-CoA racemase
MGGIGPAPFAGALLGDLGADVLRIDRIAKSGVEPDLPPRFDFYNRNKRSVAFDLKQPQAVSAVLNLVDKADALIEGFRPTVMERLGLGPEICHAINPRLVYARMTGWSRRLMARRRVTTSHHALTGALHCLGDADRPPPPPLNLVADLGGGRLSGVGLLAAAMEARQSGRGQTIDVAMIDGVTHFGFRPFVSREAGPGGAQITLSMVARRSMATMPPDGKVVAVGTIRAAFLPILSR